jgi:curved DNA-binding protein CbpA
MAERDPYAVVGVPVHASPDAVAAACRDLARRHHPDVSSEPDAQARMAEINEACSILRDPARRAAWDRISLRVLHPAAATDGYPGGSASAGVDSHPAPEQGDDRAGGPGPGSGPVGWRRGPFGEGAAGPPPGPRRGTVLPFGRHIGWSLGEVARVDPGYLVWLRDRHEGEPYRDEISALLRAMFPTSTETPTPAHHHRFPFG